MISLQQHTYKPQKVFVLETEIVNGIKRGDQKVFEQVFKQYYSALCRYAHSLTQETNSAEELVQQVFVGIWEIRTTLFITSSLKSYLYRAVHNKFLNNVKHEKVKSNYENYALQNYPTSKNSVTEKVYVNELQKKLDQSISQLPEQCRLVFTLNRYENLKYREIADALQISIKTVEAHMGKAMKILRSELADFLPLFLITSMLMM